MSRSGTGRPYQPKSNLSPSPQPRLSIVLAAPDPGVENHNGSFTATGGGVVATAGTRGATRSGVLTGGGVVLAVVTTSKSGTQVLTGSGVLASIIRKGAQAAQVLTGGGATALVGLKGAQSSQTETGGGVYTYSYSVGGGGESHSGSASMTGGGVLTFTSARSEDLVPAGGIKHLDDYDYLMADDAEAVLLMILF